ncbi:hypothetical protein [Amphritea sp. HPY]|uniref:hypothetical protein n=1 Tax=Amphritea sp. HPY TaxID=3421652 RepID=UPI003D7D857A
MLNIEGDISNLDASLDATIYRIMQEALTNVAKYAGVSQVKILLNRVRTEKQPERLLLTIDDNWKGMDLNQHRK